MFKFQELKVYQLSLEFVDLVYKLVRTWPKNEIFGLIDQIKRASVSIVLNLAEGTSRSTKDFTRFITLSKGSCYECVAILEIAKRNELIDPNEFDSILRKLEEISRMLEGLKKSLRK